MTLMPVKCFWGNDSWNKEPLLRKGDYVMRAMMKDTDQADCVMRAMVKDTDQEDCVMRAMVKDTGQEDCVMRAMVKNTGQGDCVMRAMVKDTGQEDARKEDCVRFVLDDILLRSTIKTFNC